MGSSRSLPYSVSIALAAVSTVASAASFIFWRVFSRDAPMGVGNMRGTALTVLVVAVPLLLLSMKRTASGSLRAWFVWLASLGYLAYNAVLFCFAVHFNSLFLLYTTMLALSFWALLTLLRDVDLATVTAASARVAVRPVAAYLLVCLVAFGSLWLREVIPATIHNTMPTGLDGTGLAQNPIYVLDFAFTFPLMAMSIVWLWRRRAWGYVVGGMMVIMLTIESASIAVDQVFGHVHDPTASLAAVPIMIAFTGAGLACSVLFLRGVKA